ncbi:cbb3-type cytochrome oxidase assembly protein CcoS [Marinobacter salinexigens]|uniref:Cbb3-type cytochrome oxidase assembly protein CcoS n=1 Tax=Marinobacter salinexigens TaxID=2919747 RepID=A0A5B0VLD8_9GAMM|nr:cbb3-type cytochrome oxidase assembly protein CcoS [Marinobacter salinexigens]
MQIVMILVPLVLIVVGLGVLLFSWAVKSGQYDDLEGPAHRILYDDDKDMIPEEARVDKKPDDEEEPKS